MKLTTMQDMFSSTRPVSVLDLRGDKEDDPDLFPVQFPGGPQDTAPLTRQDTWDSKPSAASTPTNSNAMSPRSSSNAVVSPHFAQSTFQPPLPLPTSDRTGFSQRGSIDAAFSQTSTSQSPSQTVPLQKSGISGNVINVFGVDLDYQAPSERPIKPGKISLRIVVLSPANFTSRVFLRPTKRFQRLVLPCRVSDAAYRQGSHQRHI